MIRYSAIDLFKFFFLFLLITNVTTSASQASSCNEAHRLQAGLPVEGELSIDSANFDFCDGSRFDICESDLKDGDWFSYSTSLAEIRIIKVEVNGEIPPLVDIFEGDCDNLSCESISLLTTAGSFKFFENKVGVGYFFYVYTTFAFGGMPYVISIEEIDPPLGDDIEAAISLSTEDLPYVGDFTTYGARSDSNLDACALVGTYGVWFKYQTTLQSEKVVLRAIDGFGQSMNVGVQYASDGGNFNCVVYSPLIYYTESVEWIVESGKIYFILVASPSPEISATFQFSLQSRTFDGIPNDSIPTSGKVHVVSPTLFMIASISVIGHHVFSR
mmetsp:Transcript_1978/g.3789  ORF Transcript_1978/g.3789 Transcript_1978/m.3789 type:complete len:329 (+) Transcript_1978:93-1079(+)